MLGKFVFVVVVLHAVQSVPTRQYEDENMHQHHVYRRSSMPGIKFSNLHVDEAEKSPKFWTTNAQNTLFEQLNKPYITKRAKNIILFLGDGMSIPTLAATRAYKGQLEGRAGEGMKLSFEEFPYTALSKTYCVDTQVADSACSATAYLCGIKANYGTIGVSANVPRYDCQASHNTSTKVYSIGRWAQQAGKSTGVVTTTRVTHASPAGVYAHTADRNWESDKDLKKKNVTGCGDIATMLVEGETGKKLNVVMGGGRRKFLPENHIDEEGEPGERIDSRNLVEEWVEKHDKRCSSTSYIWNRDQLKDLDDNTDCLMGLFESDHMQYHLDADPQTEPTLAEMTEAAIKVLSKNKNGYFLFIEGGRIDQAHHDSKAQKALDETLQFSNAIELARKLTNLDDTLIVVTSDHAHTMSLSGYADRGNDILGIAGMSKEDKRPYSTLSYANGPGYKSMDDDGNRHDIRQDIMNDKDYQFPSTAPLDSETHGGDDVGIFASGPWAHLFTGVIEQNAIPHIMAYAACIGDGAKMCDTKNGN